MIELFCLEHLFEYIYLAPRQRGPNHYTLEEEAYERRILDSHERRVRGGSGRVLGLGAAGADRQATRDHRAGGRLRHPW